MKVLRFVLLFAILSAFLTHKAAATVLLSEDFESYAINSNLAGQGGWFYQYSDPFNQQPLIIHSGTGSNSTKVADGHHAAAADGQSYLSHLISPLSLAGTTTFSGDGYAFSATPYSHGADIGLRGDSYIIRWQPNNLPLGNLSWEFSAGGTQLAAYKAYDQWVQFSIIVDASAGEVYGRLVHSGGTYETSHGTITHAQISAIDRVVMVSDYRWPSNLLGAEYDNLLLETTAVPEPTSVTLLGLGLLGFFLIRRLSEHR